MYIDEHTQIKLVNFGEIREICAGKNEIILTRKLKCYTSNAYPSKPKIDGVGD